MAPSLLARLVQLWGAMQAIGLTSTTDATGQITNRKCRGSLRKCTRENRCSAYFQFSVVALPAIASEIHEIGKTTI
jgi:hypothetical protein